MTSRPSTSGCADGRAREAISETFVWDGVTIRASFVASYLDLGKQGVVAHIEIEAISPKGTALPITETGYRSHFHAAGTVEAAGGIVAFARSWLDAAALNPPWRAAKDAARQLNLFE